MNMVDDATGTTCCRLGEQERIWAAVGVPRSWIGRYGVPRALYTDWKNVYKRQPTAGERLRTCAQNAVWAHVRAVRDSHHCSQFSAVERARGAQQRSPSRSPGEETAPPGDPELRGYERIFGSGISSGTQSAFCARSGTSRELSRSGAEHSEAERDFPIGDGTIDQQRLVVPYRGHFLQLQPQNRRYGPTKAKALVCEWEDGAVEVHYRGECTDYEDLVVRPQVVQAGASKLRRETAKRK
jgi:hypothetical protein